MKKIRVLLADDHKIFLEGLRAILEPEFEIIATVEDGRTLVAEAKRLSPDVVVADISMPGLNGIDAARQVREVEQDIRIVFLTMHSQVSYAASAFEVGASGFVLKHSAPQELITAIRETMQGRTYVTPMIAVDLIDFYQHGSVQHGELKPALSPRQREVLQLLVKGKSAKEIAAVLNISTRTVEFHKYRIMEQLKTKTSAELIQYALKYGLASL